MRNDGTEWNAVARPRCSSPDFTPAPSISPSVSTSPLIFSCSLLFLSSSSQLLLPRPSSFSPSVDPFSAVVSAQFWTVLQLQERSRSRSTRRRGTKTRRRSSSSRSRARTARSRRPMAAGDYGDIVERVVLDRTEDGQEPVFARVVLKFPACIQLVLQGQPKLTMKVVEGRDAWYVTRRRKQSSKARQNRRRHARKDQAAGNEDVNGAPASSTEIKMERETTDVNAAQFLIEQFISFVCLCASAFPFL
ncbi:uncharacterized protein LOC116261274 isoform X2 [Nymphaea colorata]|uniref:uncharacterized protein LOC116261274 isoform X2 n=1 Tax=Nymphaea colorata TaxID=210225 RepID=UPI00214F3CC3|nr:uncharacterized protein LOC116261274 isoform X2 [Nymphaea colorata]